MFKSSLSVVSASVVLALASLAPAHAADADGAQALLKANKCSGCHDVAKTKKGPSYQAIAAKYKGKADGAATVTKFITTGAKIKMDGADEEHKVIDTKDAAQLKNLAEWILSN